MNLQRSDFCMKPLFEQPKYNPYALLGESLNFVLDDFVARAPKKDKLLVSDYKIVSDFNEFLFREKRRVENYFSGDEIEVLIEVSREILPELRDSELSLSLMDFSADKTNDKGRRMEKHYLETISGLKGGTDILIGRTKEPITNYQSLLGEISDYFKFYLPRDYTLFKK